MNRILFRLYFYLYNNIPKSNNQPFVEFINNIIFVKKIKDLLALLNAENENMVSRKAKLILIFVRNKIMW